MAQFSAQPPVLPDLQLRLWRGQEDGGRGGGARTEAGQGGAGLQEVRHRPGRIPLLERVQTGEKML